MGYKNFSISEDDHSHLFDYQIQIMANDTKPSKEKYLFFIFFSLSLNMTEKFMPCHQVIENSVTGLDSSHSIRIKIACLS